MEHRVAEGNEMITTLSEGAIVTYEYDHNDNVSLALAYDSIRINRPLPLPPPARIHRYDESTKRIKYK
ncbi:hypothetical protein LENED_003755 [Lentinula edodes]|uniref:Uncharacterized protein n=1 Tax=Lentinula edodes TaxID=5353 RepID=A0A1Q3E4E9_LENED|nr:hypothetical protein LENED_003755 [Lentinula edodes]